ncbi:MAG: hypothetical protein DI598_15050 [Pseudopedobacter saltans]|uniref:Lipoprotein SmpA/OmlA domain-containing protein n=1 Tax=Pseudopedobacter saltans TaxID=151895 RepID=A0A2W5EQW1_9SPHI|nr:MAG: hypothetical protein DI598_15050 [Pseudopedobacter saltans]
MKRKILLALIGLVLLASCATTKSFDFSQVQIGMSKEEVSAKLKRPPYKILGAKQYPNGTMEVQEYYYVTMGGEDRDYWLYFWNNKLVKYETPDIRGKVRPNPWQDEMDRAYNSLGLAGR